MRRAWRIFKQDCIHATSNVIALVVCVGLVVIPSLYAWFNIAGSWDPYSNTKNLKIAVANSDEGYSSDLIPVEINIGERTASKLQESTSIGYVTTDEDDAIEGVRSGEYYAAIVIPEDFTEKMMTLLSGDPQKATIVYYSNEKENAIASIVSDKAASAVRTDVESSFDETVSEVAASTLGEVSGYLGDDNVVLIGQKLDSTLKSGSQDLRAASSHIDAYSDLLSSASSIVDSSTSLLSTTGGSASSISDALGSASTGVRQVDTAVDGATTSINTTLDSTSESFDGVSSAVDDAFDTAETDSADAAAELRSISSRVQDVIDGYSAFRESLVTLRDELGDDKGSLLDPVIARVDGILSTLQALHDRLDTAASNLENGVDSAEEDHAALMDLIASNKSQVDSVRTEYESNLESSISTLADSIDTAADSADSVSTSLNATVSSLQQTSELTSGNIAEIQTSLDDASSKLDSMADDLDGLVSSLDAAVNSGDVEQIRTILSANPTALASFLSSPVGINRTAVYPIENNGSAMAGFYSTLALFVGAIVLVAMLKVTVSEAELVAAGNARPRHAYMGRLGIYVVLAVLQALLVSMGDLFYLGIQCVHPVMFVITCCLTSLVFVNITYSLTASFGDVGKAICVFLLVIQVAGAGGTFPKEMLPAFFQTCYPFLPFVHAISCMHECIGGYYEATWAVEMTGLLTYILPCLLLGLILRKPVIRLNGWFVKKLEDTKLM